MTRHALDPRRSTTWLAFLLLILTVAAIIPQRPVQADGLPGVARSEGGSLPCRGSGAACRTTSEALELSDVDQLTKTATDR
ncbi:MAG: hypothetical protein AAF390_13615 [Pseudomonadota bacterium]